MRVRNAVRTVTLGVLVAAAAGFGLAAATSASAAATTSIERQGALRGPSSLLFDEPRFCRGVGLEEVEKLQARMGQLTAEADAGGGMVKVKVNGLMEVLRCEIGDELMKMNDREMLDGSRGEPRSCPDVDDAGELRRGWALLRRWAPTVP